MHRKVQIKLVLETLQYNNSNFLLYNKVVIEVRDHAHGLEIKELLEEKYENLFWNSEAVYDKK